MGRGAIVDAVIVVSADPDVHLGLRNIISDGVARSTMLFRSGEEMVAYLRDSQGLGRCVVVVDAEVGDIAPLNLVDAVRSTNPAVDVVVVLDSADDALVQRAMLAGARAAVRRDCSATDVTTAIERVARARHDGAGRGRSVAESSRSIREGQAAGSILAVVGARGGAGRSTMSSLLAHQAAQRGVDTGLVDLDFQFGDLRQLNRKSGSRGASLGAVPEPEGFRSEQVAENLTLYGPSEPASAVGPTAVHPARILGHLAQSHSLVIANTGAFWTLLHSQILGAADQVVCVMDQSVAGVRATARLVALCRELGISTIGFEYVVNRWAPEGISSRDVAKALEVDLVRVVPDGGYEFRVGMDGGSVAAIASGQTEIAESTGLVLEDIAARTGISIARGASGRRSTRMNWRKTRALR